MANLGTKICFGLGKSYGIRLGNGNVTTHIQWLRWTQVMSISSKAVRDKHNVQRPPPFPYDEKKYGYWQCMMDSTLHRFDDNTRLLVVEGNIGAGKTTLAKSLAELLDMKYFPESNADDYFINSYGYDVRDYAELIPEAVKPFDLNNFYKNPNHRSVATFQFLMYKLRYMQYVDALTHMMNTGQGVVLERCAYSDRVFLETMVKFGYISRQAKLVYNMLVQNTIPELMRPHLVIYLDVPVNVLKDRVKNRGIECEVNTNVLTDEYYLSIEEEYKHKYLKNIEKCSELLIYDWSEFGDVNEIVEDIERIDFDCYTRQDEKLKDWRLKDDSAYSEKRFRYTSRRHYLESLFIVPTHSAPELLPSTEDIKQYWHVYENIVPGNRYTRGYNADLGDKVSIFKTKLPRIMKM